jgi:hypothetical protein
LKSRSETLCQDKTREQASCSKCENLTDENPPFCLYLKAEISIDLADDPECEGFAPKTLGKSKGKAGVVSQTVTPLKGHGKTRANPKATCPKTMIETASELLPPIGGNYEKPKAKSTDRHRRETVFKQALEANKAAGVYYSVTTWRRLEFVFDFGSPEIKQALDHKKISISRAYNIVKAEQDEKNHRFLRDFMKLTEEERKKLIGEREHN